MLPDVHQVSEVLGNVAESQDLKEAREGWGMTKGSNRKQAAMLVMFGKRQAVSIIPVGEQGYQPPTRTLDRVIR
jgi:hypothetical protein